MIDLQTRPDALHDLVESALDQSPFLSKRTMRFEANEGHVTLRGQVGSYFQKQMAQEAVRRIDGVQRVDNHLEVDWV
jgi:osmotically-inducible protein OsmY